MKRVMLGLIILVIFLACSKSSKVSNVVIYPKETYKGVGALFAKYSCEVQQDGLVVELKPSFIADWDKLKGVITEGTKKAVNFGGKYVIIQWGCGTECQTGVIINALTGKAVRLPTSEWGSEYKKDSLLFIINPPSRVVTADRRLKYAYPAYYLWKQGKFVLLHDTRK